MRRSIRNTVGVCLVCALALVIGCTNAELKQPNSQKVADFIARVEKTGQRTLVLLLADKKSGSPKEWHDRNGSLVSETIIPSAPFQMDLGSAKIHQLEGQIVFDQGWFSKSLKVTATYHGTKLNSTMNRGGKSAAPLVVFIDPQNKEREVFVVVVNP